MILEFTQSGDTWRSSNGAYLIERLTRPAPVGELYFANYRLDQKTDAQLVHIETHPTLELAIAACQTHEDARA